MIRHNYLALLVVVLVQFAIGFIWYTFLFGDLWLEGRGTTPEEMMARMEAEGGMSPVPYIINFSLGVVMAFFMSWLVQKLGYTSFGQGAMLGLYASLGLVLPSVISHYAFLEISYTVAAIDAAMTAVLAILSGGILAAWRPKGAVQPAM